MDIKPNGSEIFLNVCTLSVQQCPRDFDALAKLDISPLPPPPPREVDANDRNLIVSTQHFFSSGPITSPICFTTT